MVGLRTNRRRIRDGHGGKGAGREICGSHADVVIGRIKEKETTDQDGRRIISTYADESDQIPMWQQDANMEAARRALKVVEELIMEIIFKHDKTGNA